MLMNRTFLNLCGQAQGKFQFLFFQNNLYDDFNYKFQTYPVPRDFYDEYKSSSKLIFDEVIEEELFGKHKYEPKQTSVMITYQP